MDELDTIACHMAIASYDHRNPKGQLWKMAERYRRKNPSLHIRMAMNAVRRDVNPCKIIREIGDERILKLTKGK